jgi:hypothetical protein
MRKTQGTLAAALFTRSGAAESRRKPRRGPVTDPVWHRFRRGEVVRAWFMCESYNTGAQSSEEVEPCRDWKAKWLW